MIPAEFSVRNQRERKRTMLMPNGMTTKAVTAMSEGNSTTPLDAAAEITDAMMSSLADVVKTVISKPEDEKLSEESISDGSEPIVDDNEEPTGPIIDTTVDDIVAEGEAAHRSGETIIRP